MISSRYIATPVEAAPRGSRGRRLDVRGLAGLRLSCEGPSAGLRRRLPPAAVRRVRAKYPGYPTYSWEPVDGTDAPRRYVLWRHQQGPHPRAGAWPPSSRSQEGRGPLQRRLSAGICLSLAGELTKNQAVMGAAGQLLLATWWQRLRHGSEQWFLGGLGSREREAGRVEGAGDPVEGDRDTKGRNGGTVPQMLGMPPEVREYGRYGTVHYVLEGPMTG